MKKKFLSLLLVCIMTSFSLVMPYTTAATTETVYLIVGQGATLDGYTIGSIQQLYLENAVEYTAEAGTPLPIPQKTGCDFVGWAYAVDGIIHKVQNMPSQSERFVHRGDTHMFLYAQWSADPEGGSGGVTPNPLLADLYLSSGSGVFDSAYQLQRVEGEENKFTITASFEQGFAFKLRTQHGMTGLKGTEFPNKAQSGKGDAGYQLDRDLVVNPQVDSSAYIALLDSEGNQIPSQDLIVTNDPNNNNVGNLYYNSFSGEPGGLKFLQGGKYTIYITIYDDGGWVRIFVKPVTT